MKTWYVGFNDWWFTSSIDLVKVPIGLAVLERIVEFICYVLPPIPLPKIKFKLKDKNDYGFTQNENGWTDLNEWYGGIDQLWHLFVCIPTINFVEKHTKHVRIELPYDFSKQLFPKEHLDVSSEYDEEENELRMKNKLITDEVYKQYKEVYEKLDFEYIKSQLK